LRNCLCHPFVYNDDIEERKGSTEILYRNLVDASSKLQLLEIMLPKLRERGHRVLIFSQFIHMLVSRPLPMCNFTVNSLKDILEDFLLGLQMPYQRLDGRVNSMEKQKRIDEFNAKDSPLFAFLLSTRAGGVGINLATADTVIITDPDFNPHQDIQAISRAHRIGQTNKVLCFQLMTRDSAEEKIVHIGRKKMALDYVFVEKLDANTKDATEIQSILQHGAAALFNEKNSVQDIKYDDASVEQLLDRSRVENTKSGEDNSAESQFRLARIWANEQGALEDYLNDLEDEKAANSSVWDKIIKERERINAETAKRAAEALGRGRRAKMVPFFNLRCEKAPNLTISCSRTSIIPLAKDTVRRMACRRAPLPMQIPLRTQRTVAGENHRTAIQTSKTTKVVMSLVQMRLEASVLKCLKSVNCQWSRSHCRISWQKANRLFNSKVNPVSDS